MPVDPKYGSIRTEKVPGNPFSEDEAVVLFRSRDENLPDVLDNYAELCQRNGSPPDHLASILNAKTEVERWQRENPDLVKVPD